MLCRSCTSSSKKGTNAYCHIYTPCVPLPYEKCRIGLKLCPLTAPLLLVLHPEFQSISVLGMKGIGNRYATVAICRRVCMSLMVYEPIAKIHV
jgi:hypothetical protein